MRIPLPAEKVSKLPESISQFVMLLCGNAQESQELKSGTKQLSALAQLMNCVTVEYGQVFSGVTEGIMIWRHGF